MKRTGGHHSLGGGNKAGLPPYVSYAVFARFLASLRQGVPSRIDRSVLGWLAPASRAQLLLALRFLRLTRENGETTERLEDLVTATSALRKRLLRETIERSYRDILTGVDLRIATSDQLEQQFRQCGASGVTLRKCLAFFRSAIDDAEIPHSSFAGKRKPGRPIGSRSATKTDVAQLADTPTPARSIGEQLRTLAAKLPQFDPGWSDEVKKAWFEAFQRLVQFEANKER